MLMKLALGLVYLKVSWPGWEEGPTNAHEKLRRLMDLPATDDLECNKNDR